MLVDGISCVYIFNCSLVAVVFIFCPLPPSFFFFLTKAYKAHDGLHPPSFRIIGMYYQAQLGKFLKGLVFSEHIVEFL